MVPSFKSWRWAKATRSSRRAMVPSSRIISQITAEGLRPASRAISTPASVCPARSRQPPSRASSGKTCPGVARSSAPLCGLMATAIVRARSGAEIPVETPVRASIETVKAVLKRLSLRCAISGRPRVSTCAPVSARQISPRPCVAIKAMAWGVAICAGITRSPSFSRSSSSSSINICPLRAASIISAGEDLTASKARLCGSGFMRRLPSGGQWYGRRDQLLN